MAGGSQYHPSPGQRRRCDGLLMICLSGSCDDCHKNRIDYPDSGVRRLSVWRRHPCGRQMYRCRRRRPCMVYYLPSSIRWKLVPYDHMNCDPDSALLVHGWKSRDPFHLCTDQLHLDPVNNSPDQSDDSMTGTWAVNAATRRWSLRFADCRTPTARLGDNNPGMRRRKCPVVNSGFVVVWGNY